MDPLVRDGKRALVDPKVWDQVLMEAVYLVRTWDIMCVVVASVWARSVWLAMDEFEIGGSWASAQGTQFALTAPVMIESSYVVR